MKLVHKLKQLINDSLEELPVRLEETRVLAHDIHDVTSNDSLVILASLHFTQPQQILDDSHQESLLQLL